MSVFTADRSQECPQPGYGRPARGDCDMKQSVNILRLFLECLTIVFAAEVAVVFLLPLVAPDASGAT